MVDREQVIYDIERCTCHVPDACRDCSKHKKGRPILSCMEELLKDAMELLKERPEIVRCKDYKRATMTSDGNMCKYCEMDIDDFGDQRYVCHDADWFCADGEAR